MHHDSSYKLIFANPEMMRDLFVGFVNEPWVADIDFSTLERFPNTYITDDLRRREDDIIWRVNIKGHTVYVYILLEFQASVDQFMAVRIMGYLALLYQDLIQSNNLAEGGLYPRFFPWCYTMVRQSGGQNATSAISSKSYPAAWRNTYRNCVIFCWKLAQSMKVRNLP
jgi:Putative transposase, YhgA-like